MEFSYRIDLANIYLYFRQPVQENPCGFNYFTTKGEIVFKPEGEPTPPGCEFILPRDVTQKDFEDAVLELADEIKKMRGEETGKIYDAMSGHFDLTGGTNESKLIDIIHILVGRGPK
jgi:hypothetical protein